MEDPANYNLMSDKQRKRFNKLTILQKNILINLLNGMSAQEAYVAGGGRCKPENVRFNSLQLINNDKFSSLYNDLKASAAERALVTAEDLVNKLKDIAQIGKPTGIDEVTPAHMVQAIKILTDYTGGFDKNTQKTEHSGYIERSESDFYDDAATEKQD